MVEWGIKEILKMITGQSDTQMKTFIINNRKTFGLTFLKKISESD